MNGQAKTTSPALEFSDTWTLLGPFRSGTREASWGADPLEQYGGFHSLVYGDDHFRSALGVRGQVSWKKISAKVESEQEAATVQLDVQFPEIDWTFLRSIYGWAALQHQAWTRGYIINNQEGERRISLFTDGILELWINDNHFFGGDFYTFRKAPIVFTLVPGVNQIDIRLIHDVRAFGGNEPPTISVGLEARMTDVHLSTDHDSIIISDLLGMKLPSPFASVICRNDGEEDLEIFSIEDQLGSTKSILDLPLRLVAGQSRPLSLRVQPQPDSPDQIIVFNLNYRSVSPTATSSSQMVIFTLRSRSLEEPHKFTFLHPSGSVSYAILRPPSKAAQKKLPGPLPVLLALHGAGLEADRHSVRHALDGAADIAAWTLFPTGSSPWSADDWHTYGFADVIAAVQAIPSWIKVMEWEGNNVDLDRWLVAGHSNGGQGVWFIVTHQPDKVIAAAPASGYTAIQNYVSYNLWQDSDPRMTALVHSALADFRHELLVPNFEGIPILQQHGSADDNVPVYHSRLMSELIGRQTRPSTYVEFEGKGHWWTGVMTTDPMKAFYEESLRQPQRLQQDYPNSFTIVIPNSHDMGSRGGICVDQLMTPDALGELQVSQLEKGSSWKISSSNVRRFHFNTAAASARSVSLTIDDQPVVLSMSNASASWLVKDDRGLWKVSSESSWRSVDQRHGRQVGSMNAILRTRSPFSILATAKTADVAVQLSRNFLQYFGADSHIQISKEVAESLSVGSGNRILVIEAGDVPGSVLQNFPFEIGGSVISIRTSSGVRRFGPRTGLGALYLRPLKDEGLELVIWGADERGLQQISRLAPMLTGVGQPDFIVLDDSARFKGHGGVLASGFFDYRWNVSGTSFIK